MNTENDAKVVQANKIRWGLSLALGMLVVLWRVVLPRNVEITVATVILVAVLDLILTAVLIFINKDELKDVLLRKFTKKDFLRTIISFIILILASPVLLAVANQIIVALYNSFPAMGGLIILPGYSVLMLQSPADWTATQFFMIFPMGMFVSGVIAAPIWEEIVFRMAGRNLIKNAFLYLIITSLLFGFIHTASFLTPSIIRYVLNGMVFGLIYVKTKDLRILIAIHFIGNLIGMTMGFLSLQ
ncbi:MAG: CPBP family intramembrane metalloprotease [Defluviitaleaceae bacterium]|nr:CPBP family intramembrane metalloprotease [Defluviitaleaceae bacterium]